MTTNFRSLIFRLVFFGKINSYIFPTSSRSSHQRCSVKKAAFNIFAIFAGKNLCWSLYLIRLQAWRPATLLKSDSNAGSSCKYCKIINNTYFEEHPWTTASELRRLPVLLLCPIQIYMSVLITNMVLTAWGPSHLSQNTTFGENLIKVAIFNIRKRGLRNVKCNSHQTWYMFIYNLIYLLIIEEALRMLVISLLYSKPLNQIPVNTSKSKQNVKISKPLNYVPTKFNTFKVNTETLQIYWRCSEK